MSTLPFAFRRYLFRVIPCMLAYVGLLFGSNMAIRAWDPEGAALAALAVLPALPILGVIWALGMVIVEQTDEYQRMKMVRAILIATAILLSVTTVWSFLEDDGLISPKPQHLTFPLWCFGLIVGQLYGWVRDLSGRGA